MKFWVIIMLRWEDEMITIKRIAANTYGTFGVLLDVDLPFALTLERQWLYNLKNNKEIKETEYAYISKKTKRNFISTWY